MSAAPRAVEKRECRHLRGLARGILPKPLPPSPSYPEAPRSPAILESYSGASARFRAHDPRPLPRPGLTHLRPVPSLCPGALDPPREQTGWFGQTMRRGGGLGYPKGNGWGGKSASLPDVPAHPVPAKCLALNSTFKKVNCLCQLARYAVVRANALDPHDLNSNLAGLLSGFENCGQAMGFLCASLSICKMGMLMADSSGL